MISNFYSDLSKARKAENLVYQVLSALTDDYAFEEVGDKREYFYKGDVKAHDECWDDDIFVEVKDDSCIYRTGNVLCEDKVFYKNNGEFGKGNMQSDYDYYAVVSQHDNLIYILDFDVLKKNYKKGQYKIIPHEEQNTYCYLCSINKLCKWGAMMYYIWYEEKDGKYYPVKVEKEDTYKFI